MVRESKMKINQRTIDYETTPITGHFIECHNCGQDTNIEQAIPITAGGKDVALCEYCYDTVFSVTPLFRVSETGDKTITSVDVKKSVLNTTTIARTVFALVNLFVWIIGWHSVLTWVF